MNCEEISELLPAYVLGALEPDEMALVEAHLRAGREHDDELVELRATLFALDRYQDELAASPSPVLASRVAGIVKPAAGAATRPSWISRWFATPPWLRAAATAVVLLLVFAAGLVAGSALTGGDDSALAYVLQDDTGAFMEVRGAPEGSKVTVTMDGLERLSGNSYQVWAVRDDEWVSVGVCNTNEDGWWRGDFAYGLQEDDDFALTVEPRGGSESPTSEPLLSSTH